MTRAKIYIDTNIIKFSATSSPRFRSRELIVNWGGTRHPLTVSDQITVNKNERIANPELRREAELLPQVAALATRGIADFFISIETKVEASGLPDLDSETGMFYGAPIRLSMHRSNTVE